VGAGMEAITQLPGGAFLVFLLAAGIATAAFLGRSVQTRRLHPQEAG
jgi:hypothetical protein